MANALFCMLEPNIKYVIGGQNQPALKYSNKNWHQTVISFTFDKK